MPCERTGQFILILLHRSNVSPVSNHVSPACVQFTRCRESSEKTNLSFFCHLSEKHFQRSAVRGRLSMTDDTQTTRHRRGYDENSREKTGVIGRKIN